MDTNKEFYYQESGMDIRELIITLWKKKIVILSFTLITSILTGIYSFFIIPPVYLTNLNIIINMPEIYSTRFGDYSLPITTNQQYIDLIKSDEILQKTIDDMGYTDVTIENMKKRIAISSNTKVTDEQNSFNIKVSAEYPQEAKKLAKTLYANYIEFIDIMTIEGAVNFYIKDYTVKLSKAEVELDTARGILKTNEELLVNTPITINQKEALNEIKNLESSEYIIFENIINPNYTKIETDIIGNKQTINNIENNISIYEDHLAKLDFLKGQLNKYDETNDFNELRSNIVIVTETNIYLPSEPAIPSQKTEPKNVKNIVIGAMLGSMIGLLYVVIKDYWFKKN